MPNPHLQQSTATLDRADLARLFDALRARGYQVVGPTVREGATIYDSLAGPEQLPVSWTEEQDGSKYRLKKRQDAAPARRQKDSRFCRRKSPRPNSPFSASVRANYTPLPFRTKSSSVGRLLTRRIRRGGKTFSLSRSTADWRAALASVSKIC